ncbi:kinase-like domain-containing protein [Favolaschia claudopus]|uniref:Kinase-like domain-containing protein n=1 Tax=Favolaschia claudopus TaxID=2862362 RepID=A0AAW0AEJ2_9AGAR
MAAGPTMATGNAARSKVKAKASDLSSRIRANHRTLYPYERWWVEHQPFLLSLGYALRERYHPDWIATWDLLGNEEVPSNYFEDSIPAYSPGNVLDATRTTDGVKVVLKRVNGEEEAALSIYCGKTLPEMDTSTNNRAVPVLDKIDLPEENKTLIVLPFLREFNDPPFERVGEVIEALHQFMKGMRYLHSHNIAHRDLGGGNFMMDASRVVPGGWHMFKPWLLGEPGELLKLGSRLQTKSRLQVSPTQYFIIDFGLATCFPPGISLEDARATGVYGQCRKEIPEMSDTVPYNPFKVDIYQMGRVILDLVEVYHGLEIFRTLANRMMAPDPDERPWAAECVEIFEQVSSSINLERPVVFRSSGGHSSWLRFVIKQLMTRF